MSCKIIKERERVEETIYFLNFDISNDGGYAFPCDDKGNVMQNKITDDAKRNYQYCLDHPEKFIRKPYVHKESHSYTECAIAKCECGEEFELFNKYLGACECPKCGKWYNLFAQELRDPKYWNENY